MKQLKNLLPLMLLALLAWNCQKEEISIPQENITGATAPSAIQKIDYRQLPLHIRDEVSHSVGAARGKGRTGKGGEPFGDVRQDRVDVMETGDGTTSYTLGMEKLAEGTYMDRLVVTEDVDGRLSTHILRYRPSGDWLARRASGETGWEAYTGDIAIFDGEGDPKAAGHFNGGQVTAQSTGKGTAGKSDEMDCTITDISMGGVQQGDTLYVTDIIIEYECSGSGTNDGDDDPDPGLDNGGGEFPQDEGPQGGGGGGNGEQIPTIIDDELVLEDKIDNLISNLCAKNIVDEANSMDNEISNQMKSAFGSYDSDYDLIYQNDSIPEDNPNEITFASTGAKVDENNRINEITITLNNDFLKVGTDVAIFNWAVHENIHALMLYQLDKMEIAPDDPNVDFSILADLWSEALALKDAQGNVGTTALESQMHEIMSGVISTQASIVLDYALSKGCDMSIAQAEALAWSGLQSSIAWTVMDEFVKETYDNIISYEVSGFEILAVGTKCN
jgi:hypothetical protein